MSEAPAPAPAPIENLPEDPSKKSGGGSPLVPVLLMVVLLPVLSFVSIKFFLLPQLQQTIIQAVEGAANKKAEGGGGGEVHGGGGGGHGKEGGGHGGGHGGDGGNPNAFEFQDIIANLAGALHSRYVKVSFTVEGSKPDFVHIMEANKAKLIDATLGTLSSLSIVDLETPGIKNVVRNDLLTAFEIALNGEVVEQLYFSEFVVQ